MEGVEVGSEVFPFKEVWAITSVSNLVMSIAEQLELNIPASRNIESYDLQPGIWRCALLKLQGKDLLLEQKGEDEH